ncbi:polysaccharide biosynthesis/export family protein [Bergeyella sp. RCAD1439]|uniref:polysaccharide biosynthesis/export family protein n=1 Tax=Bergeyella anatis TaxID=3113737 RepID=UPI002E1819BC|nr:polysaccharide biosynthesis/export family protein [Bergeyella sp. RCAD1439]
MLSLSSCISTSEVRYMQPSESLVINEEGLVPYGNQDYRVTKNDIFSLNIVTTPKGDAAQFYSNLNASGEGGQSSGAAGAVGGGGVIGGGGAGSMAYGNARFYFDGIKVDAHGDIYVFGIGYIKAEGRTIEDIQKEIQTSVNENFLEGKSEVRLNLDGINYYILGDIETTQLTGAKKSYTQTLNIMEAIAQNGGLNRTVDRKNVMLQRRYPEGIKTVRLDLTREDVMNSPYYWLQNGDIIYLNTRPKSFHGFGRDPLQTVTTGVSLLTTAMSIYLLLSRL